MTIRPGSEFNIVGAPSEELKRHLLYLATIDSDAVHSGYKSANALRAGAAAGNAEEADNFLTLAQAVMAHQTQFDRLNERLAEMNRASLDALHEAEAALEELTGKANRTRDGRLVFHSDDDGKYYGDDGNEIDAAEIDLLTWNPDAPTWEMYDEQRHKIEAIKTWREKLKNIENDTDETLTEDEIDAIEKDLDDLEAAIPGSASWQADRVMSGADAPRTVSAARDLTGASFENVPELNGPFTGAVLDDAPEDAAAPPQPQSGPDFTL